MYLDHFGLKQKPFSIAPDPAFIYLSDKHREALAHLMYGLESDGGFVLVSGEVGTGKTTLLRNLIAQVPADQDVAFILNPRLTVRELLESLCDELGIDYQSDTQTTVKHYIDRLNRHLLRTHAMGRGTVMIIDEAQNLSPAVLEQIRLLTNLETNEKKLLRIILLGQPELVETLARPELRQLAQRITARYHLTALTREDTSAYIHHRMQISGNAAGVFKPAACRKIFNRTGGIPRLINILCDRCLLGAFVEGKHHVDNRVVARAAKETLPGLPQRHQWWKPSAITAAAMSLVGIGWWVLIGPDPVGSDTAGTFEPEPTGTIDRPVGPAAPELSPLAELDDPAPAASAQVALASQSPSGKASESAAPATIRPAAPTTFKSVAPATVAPAAELSIPSPLTTTRSYRSKVSANRTMFNAWGATYDMNQTACEQAADAALRCLQGSATLAELLELNRPAVLELWSEDPRPFYAAIVATDGTSYTLAVDGAEQDVNAATLSRHWFGNYTLLWQVPPGFDKIVARGESGPQVEWLRQRLETATQSELSADEPDRFDPDLTRALQRYQREHGLRPDGIAGPLTLIHLHTQSGIPVPRLR